LRRAGVPVVDRVVGGIAPGLPLVLAGPAGCGRTVLALQLAAAALREEGIVIMLTAEPAPLLLRQAETLDVDLEAAVCSEQLLLLEIDPRASGDPRRAPGGLDDRDRSVHSADLRDSRRGAAAGGGARVHRGDAARHAGADG
jgi:KaiC/GvpD/RAD55 family RecA-like ATPase